MRSESIEKTMAELRADIWKSNSVV
jgi:hypothetical protein